MRQNPAPHAPSCLEKLAALFFAIIAAAPGSPGQSLPDAYPDFDARDSANAPAVHAAYRSSQLRDSHAVAVTAALGAIPAAEAALRTSLPGLQVERSRFSAAPEAVGAADATQFLTVPSPAPHEATVRRFLFDHALLYGLAPAETDTLVPFADYANPAGNLSWVGLKQEINGLPVFQGEILAAFTATGALARTTGNLAVGLDPTSLSAAPILTPPQAAVSAAATVGRRLDSARLTLNSTDAAGRISFVGGGPYRSETRTELMYFPVEPGVATLAYAVILWETPRAYYLLVDANDGTLLFRKCITQDQMQSVTYNVYADDSPAPLSPTDDLPGDGSQPRRSPG